ncbi:MAG TPA: hypothetical protein VL728_12745 [Cyclobacteriaceae bacterium]|jgi:hypothetical protein|nr:hypothetical protein [Cyclobacteriaceae bacterium]
MKKLCAAAIAVVSIISSYGQTLYIPSGTSGIGSSTTSNVGIGTSSPQEALHINGNLRGSVNGAVRISTGYGTMDIGAQNSSYAHFYTNMPAFFFGNPMVVAGPISSHTSYDLNLQTAGTTRMTILNSNGNVGIGVNPEKTFDVNGDLQIRASTYYKGVSWQNIQSRFYSYGGNGTDAQWLIHTMPETGGRFVISSGPVGANGSTNQAFSVEGNKNSIFYGNVGVGTVSPAQKLEVVGNTRIDGPTSTTHSDLEFYRGDGLKFASIGQGNLGVANSTFDIQHYNGNDIRFLNNGTEQVRFLASNGNVGIGTANPDYKLTVNGSVHAKEVRVDLNVPAPDYVFQKDYQLTPLDEIKNYIDQNKHLPEVPSAKEMEKNGVQLGEMNMILLKKIEELTLYVIELKKENEAQNKTIDELKKNK